MLGRGGGDSNSRVEIIRVLDDCSGVVERVNHVVNCWAVLCSLVCSADKDEILICSHPWASRASADIEELDDQQVELKDELSYVLVLPDTFVNFWWEFTYFLNVRWITSYFAPMLTFECLHLLMSSCRYSWTAKGPFIFEMSSIPLLFILLS